MSRSRLFLHLGALFAPLAAAGTWCLMLYRSEVPSALGIIGVVGGLGVLSAQVAAFLRWHALDLHARAGHGAWRTGIGMAAITHALFGVLLDGALVLSVGGWREAAGTGKASDLLLQSLFFFFVSVMPLGLVTFPATAFFATWIAALRRKELGNAVA